MPDNRPDEEPPREEPGGATPPEFADGQDQDAPIGHGGKTFLEHAREAVDEHDILGRLLAESERRCRESREQGPPEDPSDWVYKGGQPGYRSCPDP